MTTPDAEPGFSLARRARSFADAFRGIAALVAGQHNARIHLLATVAVGVAGFWLGASLQQWALLLLAMGLVWSAEAFNTAVELVADAVCPDHHPLIGRAKDVAAAGVLLASAAAAGVGLLVFLPLLLG
jgi:diacylglycerol kinase (ATP)